MSRKHIDRINLKRQTIDPAKEVLTHIYQTLLKIPEITLRNGMKASIDPFYPPDLNDSGQVQCGFDILLDNGSHLEFLITNTGWGKALLHSEKNQNKQ